MKIPFLIFALFSFLFISCEREGSGNCTETNISTANRSSHNRGEDCTKCHSSGNDGNGCFSICGSAFKSDKITPIQNAVMVLFSKDANGKFVDPSKAIPIDKSGNFYTTETISFAGKYPAIITNGDTSMMGGALTNNASCNKCHATNGAQDPIYSQY
jgi:hypothetical protein